MITTFGEAEKYLSRLTVKSTSPSERLEFVRNVLALLAHPQNTVPAVHIAGTSGKGSTAYYAAFMLQQAGYRVGLAVSPHVNNVAERSQINGSILPEDEYCRYFTDFTSVIESHQIALSYIEFLTIFTFWLFAQQNLDYMVIEVGLGGRLDSTNTITRPSTVRVLTDIGLDHTEILGDTLTAIAAEKAGIIHHSDMVVAHKQPKEVLEVFQHVASLNGATLILTSGDSVKQSRAPGFQQRNVTLAYAAAQTLLQLNNRPPLPFGVMVDALSLQIPGRFEQLHYEGVDIILDVAHNAQKIAALVEAVRTRVPAQEVECLVSFASGKVASIPDSLVLLRQCARRITVTGFTTPTFGNRGAVPIDVMRGYAQKAGFNTEHIFSNPDPYAALKQVVASAQKHNSTVVITGSFYLIDGIRKLILDMRYNESVGKGNYK